MTNHPYDLPSDPAKRVSAALTDGPDRAGARAMLKGTGFTDADLAKPIIGVATTWIETMPCNLNQRDLAVDVKRGIRDAGKGGEDAPEMMKRLQTAVIDMHPDLVIWQVGTNAVLRNLDPGETAKLVEEGITRIQAAGADVVLIDPQYSPKVNEHAESAGKMMTLLNKVAELRKVGLFPRFAVMKDWHEKQAIPIENFVIADGLHMSDWGYACFAQLLGDDIIRSVGQIKLGVNVPSGVRAYRPM